MGKAPTELTATAEKQQRQLSAIVPEDEAFNKLFGLERLRATFKNLRREFQQLRARDVIDWTDWFLELDECLPQLRSEILSGEYAPAAPTRYEMGKTKGAFRVISSFNIRDALVYRHLCDEVLERALPSKVKGAFFSRRWSITPVGKTFELSDDNYERFYEIWLRYQEYRERTALNDAYGCVVVSDISNYFDSIQHDLLMEYLAPYGLAQKAIGLLGRLLETFKPLSGHSPTPRVGLAVDELDCSRQLAHVFLFHHDKRIVEQYGEDNFVRWMDDQTIGTADRTLARKVVYTLTKSLASQRLTVNSGKTEFLEPDRLPTFFQLRVNEKLTEWQQRYKHIDINQLSMARALLFRLWESAQKNGEVGEGYWDKVLKRFYACAIAADSALLEDRALDDLINVPDLDERIFDYFAKRNRTSQLLDIFEHYCEAGENLFEATESVFFQSLLLCDVRDAPTEGRIVDVASRVISGKYPNSCRRPLGRSSAMLALYWFSTKPIGGVELFNVEPAAKLPKEVARYWLAIGCALDPSALGRIRDSLFGHPSDDVARLYKFLSALFAGSISTLGRYRNKKTRWPRAGQYYDTRTWLLFDLASHSPNKELRSTLKSDLKSFERVARTAQERRILDRVTERFEIK